MASLEVGFCGLKRYFRMIYMYLSTNCYKWIGPCKDLNIVASKCPSMVILSYSIPCLVSNYPSTCPSGAETRLDIEISL